VQLLVAAQEGVLICAQEPHTLVWIFCAPSLPGRPLITSAVGEIYTSIFKRLLQLGWQMLARE
jgi:hypothetical protein